MRFESWRWLILTSAGVAALSLRPTSSFLGNRLPITSETNAIGLNHRAQLFMRKQKASDKRTRRKQRGEITEEPVIAQQSLTTSPMTAEGAWKLKTATRSALLSKEIKGGRGRSRKRSMLYGSLSFYQNKYMNLLQAEYKAEVRTIYVESST